MSYIKSRKHAVTRSAGPITSMAAMTMLSLASSHAVAQSGDAEPRSSGTLGEVTVRDSAESYKADTVSSPKYTAPLLDTPQTITVVPTQVLQEQNSLSLQEALTNNVPGITFQAGEGGGGYGDNIMLRGYSASNNISQDGIPDSGQYTRSDFFNIESIEVTNGASSVYGGSGNVGGGINLVSKQPSAQDFTKISAGLGTAKYGRATVDMNRRASDSVAWRLNAMVHRNELAERDEERFKRFGIAPSVKFGINTPTQVSLSYFYQKDDNIPQYGVPYVLTPFHTGPVPGISRSNFYQYRNTGNGEETDNHRLSALIEHRFSDSLRMRNFTRLGLTERWTQIDSPRGTWCVNGVNPFGQTAAQRACRIADNTYLPNSGPHGYVRDEKNRIVSNQTDLIAKATTGQIEHDIVAGLYVAHETLDRTVGSVLNNPDGTSVAPADRTAMSALNPEGVWNGPVNYVRSQYGDGKIQNVAIYAFDNIKLNQQWSLNTGVRFEHFRGESLNNRITDGTLVPGERMKNSDNLLSFMAGAVYKPMSNGSVYASISNSKTPSQGSVRLSCNARNCNVDPETAVNYELGTKWDLMDSRLSLTAAIFRNERKNYKVEADETQTLPMTLDGKSRVDGIVLGAAGNITSQWGLFANYSYLNSEVIQGVSNAVRAATGVDAQAGQPLTQVPKHAANLWTSYDFAQGWSVGYGFTYTGKMQLNNGEAPYYNTKAYVVQNAMLGYRFDKQLSFQLNAKNLTNKEYYTRVRGSLTSSSAVPGTGRTITLTGNYEF
ncbi:MAG: TonB-dependent siderophore receptor [Lautropia sp.]|nr:TonB-dependent siderophore receptor [Lautropia sp.]